MDFTNLIKYLNMCVATGKRRKKLPCRKIVRFEQFTSEKCGKIHAGLTEVNSCCNQRGIKLKC